MTKVKIHPDGTQSELIGGKWVVVTEAMVEKYLLDEVEKLGGEVRKVKWRGRSRAPDTRVMLPYSSGTRAFARSFWAELKRPGYKETPRTRAQKREHERMRAYGEDVRILASYEAVDRALRV